MALKGDLKSLSLANVLQDLAQNEQTGTLKLEAAGRRRYFWFEKGSLRLVGLGNSRGPSLINGLLATGKVALSDVGPAARASTEIAMVRTLIKSGKLPREAVKAAIEQQMMELACDAFLWGDATFEFAQGDPADDQFETSQLDHEPRLACDVLIMEALRRIDEWPQIKKVVLSAQEIYLPEAGRSLPPVDPITGRVHAAVDGERRLQDIMDGTHLGQFNVFKGVATLKAAGVVRLVTVDEALARGRDALQRGRGEVALHLARFALEREPNHRDLRRLSAEALEALDRRDEAAAEYRILAAAQVEQAEAEPAVATCRKILALAPRDTFTHDRLFQLLLQLGRREEALAQGESLAATCKRAGLSDKAKEVYTRLMAALGDSDELVESLADIARHLGDKKEAIQLYRRLFERASARGDEDQVVQLSRTLLRLDPGQEDIVKRRMEIETGVYHKRRARKRRIRIAVIASLALAALAGWALYEGLARSFHSRLLADSIPLMAKDEYASILKGYDRLRTRWPLALIQLSAEEERARIETLFVEQQLALIQKLEADHRLPEAVAMGEVLRDLARHPDHRAVAADRLQALLRARSAEENRYLEKILALAKEARTTGRDEPLQELAAIVDPLAIPALRECLKDDSPAVRRAAVTALRTMETPDVLDLLVHTLAADTDPSVVATATQALNQKTGQSFTTAREWDEWLRKQASREGAARIPPLQALLTGPSSGAAGRPIRVRWELINVGIADAEFILPREFGPVYRGTGPAGVVTQVGTAVGKVDRTIRLHPGELIAGSADLAAVCQGLEAPGLYRFSWTGIVRWPSGISTPIESLPLSFEMTK